MSERPADHETDHDPATPAASADPGHHQQQHPHPGATQRWEDHSGGCGGLAWISVDLIKKIREEYDSINLYLNQVKFCEMDWTYVLCSSDDYRRFMLII